MRVLLVDDHALLVEGLQNLLEAHGIEVVGVARDGLEARAQANALKPEIILMDIRMPRCDGLTATRLIKADMPDTKIVILTTSDGGRGPLRGGQVGSQRLPAEEHGRRESRRSAPRRRRRTSRPSPPAWRPSCWLSSREAPARSRRARRQRRRGSRRARRQSRRGRRPSLRRRPRSRSAPVSSRCSPWSPRACRTKRSATAST